MIVPQPIPDDIASGVVTFVIDDQAEPSDCAEPLAALLIDLWRKRQAPHADCPQCATGLCGGPDCRRNELVQISGVVQREARP